MAMYFHFSPPAERSLVVVLGDGGLYVANEKFRAHTQRREREVNFHLRVLCSVCDRSNDLSLTLCEKIGSRAGNLIFY
jgi:hypothetical protein